MAANKFNREDGTFAAIGSGDVLSVSAATIIGTTTSDSAAAGIVGEYISLIVPIASAVPLTSGVSSTIGSVSLTPGDWDVHASLWTNPAAGTLQTTIQAGVNTSSTLPGTPANGTGLTVIYGTGAGAGAAFAVPIEPSRISLATTTATFLIANIAFSVSSLSGYGKIAARRVR